MAIASGLGGQLGIATETTPGTFVTPASFLKFLEESLETKLDYSKVPAIAAGMAAQDDGLHVQTTRHVEGAIQPVPLSAGFGKILNLLAPGTIAPVGAGAAKTYTFPIGAVPPDGKSVSLQVGVPGTDGTVRAKSVTGAVIESITFAMERGGTLTCTANIWGSDLVTTETLAVATYPAGTEAFGFLQSQLQIDDAAVGSCVRSFTITYTFPKANDRYCMNGSGTGLVPITNGLITVTGSYVLEFSGGWTQYNAFRNATRRKLTVSCLGRTEIETGVKPEIAFEVPKMVVIDNGTPFVSGPDLVTTTASFEGVTTPGTALSTIKYVTSDTAL
jgi:hypothetical protein